MPAITGSEVIGDAFGLLNVFIPGASIPNAQAQFARRFLNDMLSEWAQRSLMIPVIGRERFDLVSDQGGEDDPYTIGDGADFDTTKPANQNSIVAANLILTASDPDVRVPLGIYTDQSYVANAIPGTSSGQPTGLYYNPTNAPTGWGSVYLCPVPDNATNDIELFIEQALAQFADLVTTYYVPDSVPQALKYNLADRLQAPFGRELPASAQRIAVSSLSTFKRSNTKLSDLANEATWASHRHAGYNIHTGTGG